MKTISIYKEQSEQTMTSLEIAELTGKQHKNIMQAIRNMEPAWEKVNGLKFQLVEYKDAKGELRPCYQLTKTECLYIATKFNDEARARLVLRWQELELREQERRQQLALPSPKKMSSYNFNAVLRDMGIQYRRHSRWNICEELEERGLTVKKSVKSVESVVKKSGICGKQLVKVVKVIWSKSIYDHEVILTNTNCTNLTNLRLIALLSLKARRST